jgi:hypothetical protein
MKPEDIVVLVLTASFVGFVVWLAIRTRRQPAGADSFETPTKGDAPNAANTCQTERRHYQEDLAQDLRRCTRDRSVGLHS